MNQIYFIYHGNCFDGFGAAFSAWKYFKGTSVNPIFIPAKHGDPFPLNDESIKGSEIYIADFAYPRDELLRVKMYAKKLFVLDHHKTAEAQLSGLDFCLFDMTRSGAMITWDYFHKNIQAPKLIQYIQDRDLWKFQLPFSKEVNTIIQSHAISEEKDFEAFDQLLNRLNDPIEFQSIVNEGKAILRFQEQFVQLAITRSFFMIHLDGYNVPAVNTSVFESEICNKLLILHPNAPFVATFYLTDHSGVEKYSLRSRGDFDVSTIARKFGGGGHLAAAGFQRRRPM